MKKTFGSKPEGRHESRFLIEEDEILSDLAEKKGSSLFLGKYTEKVVLEILERNGFFKKVKEAMKKHTYLVDWEGFGLKFEAEMSCLENDFNPMLSS